MKILVTDKNKVEHELEFQFNKSLGYVLVPGQEKSTSLYYVLTREDYISKTEILRKTASKLTGDFLLPRAYGDCSEINLTEINDFLTKNRINT